MINQLRIYELFPETQPEFLDRFHDHAARIMHDHDFKILAMWTTTHGEKPAFAYLLSWHSDAAMAEGWSRFMADEEWQSIKAQRDPSAGPIVGDIVDLQLDPVTFSKAL